MLYLSRIMLDTHNRRVQQDLGNCHHLHRRVLQAFDTAPDGTQAREYFGVLYRAEAFERDPRLVRLLVQSAVAPAWERLPDTYFATTPDERGNPAVRLVESEYDQIRPGMPLIFRLRANPTRRVGKNNTSQAEEWRGKRIELRREEDQLAWLERKGQHGGFRLVRVAVRPELPDTRVTTQEKTRGWRRTEGTASAMRLTFGAALFEGRLEVTDREQFLTTLRVGIGSGKAFGFGLLSVATAR
jgi:CRISPR system Cascade subunit CasE